jgi:hypothetical protein
MRVSLLAPIVCLRHYRTVLEKRSDEFDAFLRVAESAPLEVRMF